MAWLDHDRRGRHMLNTTLRTLLALMLAVTVAVAAALWLARVI